MTKTTKHFHLKIKTNTKSKMPARINTASCLFMVVFIDPLKADRDAENGAGSREKTETGKIKAH